MLRKSIVVCFVAFVALLAGSSAQSRDITLLVTADMHFGFDDATTVVNVNNIAMMNSLPGVAYPASIGGVVQTPSGVVVLGDLTQGGKPAERKLFENHYPLHGGKTNEQIRYPVFECLGNHDRRWRPVAPDKSVGEMVKDRHGDTMYGFDLQGVQFYLVGEYPNELGCQWLAKNLASIGKSKPIVLFFHYDLWDDKWWSPAQRENFRTTIDGYNVLAIIHGHKHDSFIYKWNGYDVFSPGSPKSEANQHNIGVLNITDDRVVWAERDCYDGQTHVAAHWECSFAKTFATASVEQPKRRLLIQKIHR